MFFRGILGMVITTLVLLSGVSLFATEDRATNPRPASPEQMQWFRDAKFGLFIHWGPASISGAEISWGRQDRIETGGAAIVGRAAAEFKFAVEFLDEAGAAEHGDGFAFVPSEPSELIEFHARILAGRVGQIPSGLKIKFAGKTPGGTLWVSGTHHSISLVGYVLQKLGFRILNDIVWEKPNPPSNLSCRYFTHSTETLIWAARSTDTNHVFNNDLMRKVNRGTQMQTVWRLNAPPPDEKALGGHPTQKPVALVTRTLLAATCEGDFVFDPFLGSGTTAVACLRTRRRFVGIDSRSAYVTLAVNRTKAEVEKGADLFTPDPERHLLTSGLSFTPVLRSV